MSGVTIKKAAQPPAESKSKVDLGLLEEDDEFEEFPADSWAGGTKSIPTAPGASGEEEDEIKVWEDNWDDDNIEDDFSNQLKAELQKQQFNSTGKPGAISGGK